MLVVCETLTKIYCFNGGNEMEQILKGSKQRPIHTLQYQNKKLSPLAAIFGEKS